MDPRRLDPLPCETLHLPFGPGPHRLALGLAPLASGLFEFDQGYRAEMGLRRKLLDWRREDVFAAVPGSEKARRDVLDHVASVLSAQHPSWFERDGDRLHNRLMGETWDLATPPYDPLELAGRLVQEDLCLLQPGADGPVLTASVLCFPSRWRLADKIGRGIAAIHAAVPGFGAALAAPVDRVLARLPAEHPVARLNWSIVDDASLHLPDSSGLPVGVNPDVTAENAGTCLFLRVERQTLSPLPECGGVLFTIRVHVYPLAVAIGSCESAVRLAAAVRALPEDMLRYKHFLAFREALLLWLDSVVARGDNEKASEHRSM